MRKILSSSFCMNLSVQILFIVSSFRVSHFFTLKILLWSTSRHLLPTTPNAVPEAPLRTVFTVPLIPLIVCPIAELSSTRVISSYGTKS